MADGWMAWWQAWQEGTRQHAGTLWLAVAVVALVLWLQLAAMARRVRRAERYYRLTAGDDAADVMAAVERCLGRVAGVEQAQQALSEEVGALQAKVGRGLRYVGMVRYDAFTDAFGELSVALALLDDHDNGLVLNGIVGRDTARTYLKHLRGGHASLALTDEERAAIAEARRQRRELEGSRGG